MGWGCAFRGAAVGSAWVGKGAAANAKDGRGVVSWVGGNLRLVGVVGLFSFQKRPFGAETVRSRVLNVVWCF